MYRNDPFQFTLYSNSFLRCQKSLHFTFIASTFIFEALSAYQALQVHVPIEGGLKGLCLPLSKAIAALCGQYEENSFKAVILMTLMVIMVHLKLMGDDDDT